MHTGTDVSRNCADRTTGSAEFPPQGQLATAAGRLWLRVFVAITSVAMLPGCAADDFMILKKDKVRWADAKNPTYRCLSIWQPAEGWGIDDRPARGFAGQIYFFTKGTDGSPVAVNGEVRIFVFDNQGTPEEQAKPIHQFVFEEGAWNKYLYDTQLGPAYNIFIPYTRKGYHSADCSLRVRLTPPDGPVIYSKMVNIALPGSEKKSDTDKKSVKAPDANNTASTSTPTAEINADDSENRLRPFSVKPHSQAMQQVLRHAAGMRDVSSTTSAGRPDRIDHPLAHRQAEPTNRTRRLQPNLSLGSLEQPTNPGDRSVESSSLDSHPLSGRRFRLSETPPSEEKQVHPLAEDSEQPSENPATSQVHRHPLSSRLESDESAGTPPFQPVDATPADSTEFSHPHKRQLETTALGVPRAVQAFRTARSTEPINSILAVSGHAAGGRYQRPRSLRSLDLAKSTDAPRAVSVRPAGRNSAASDSRAGDEAVGDLISGPVLKDIESAAISPQERGDGNELIRRVPISKPRHSLSKSPAAAAKELGDSSGSNRRVPVSNNLWRSPGQPASAAPPVSSTEKSNTLHAAESSQFEKPVLNPDGWSQSRPVTQAYTIPLKR